jgi:hypothetical protein
MAGILQGLPLQGILNSPATANPNMMAQAANARAVNPRPVLSDYQAAQMAGMIPGAGLLGILGDIGQYMEKPETRGILNYGLTALGAVPFLGAMAKMSGPLRGVPRSQAGAIGDRTFYRGTVPGETKRITTGNEGWDGHLFASADRDKALLYGPEITTIQAKPEANILYEGTADFVKVAGKWRKNESLLDFASRAADSAKASGYDAVHFKRQGDVGTAIFNREKFIVK